MCIRIIIIKIVRNHYNSEKLQTLVHLTDTKITIALALIPTKTI